MLRSNSITTPSFESEPDMEFSKTQEKMEAIRSKTIYLTDVNVATALAKGSGKIIIPGSRFGTARFPHGEFFLNDPVFTKPEVNPLTTLTSLFPEVARQEFVNEFLSVYTLGFAPIRRIFLVVFSYPVYSRYKRGGPERIYPIWENEEVTTND